MMEIWISSLQGGDLVGAAEAELSWFEHPDDSIHSLWEKRVVLKGTRFGTCFAEDLNGDGRPDIASLQRPVGYFLNSPAGGVQFSDSRACPPFLSDTRFGRIWTETPSRISWHPTGTRQFA
jgi:hypothetical protein